MARTFDVRDFFFRSISNNNLLEDTNAISIPEKKAESNNEIVMVTIVFITICYPYLLGIFPVVSL